MAARSWGVQPSEYWGMTVAELLCDSELHRPSQKGDYAGGMTVGDLESISEESKALREHLEKLKNGS